MMARERSMSEWRSPVLRAVRQTTRRFAYPEGLRTRCARVALAALLVVPLCACPQLGGDAGSKSDPAASGTAATPPADMAAKVLVTTLATVPERTIAHTNGFACRFFLWSGDGNYANKFEGALHILRSQAAKQGADAVVNLKVSAIPFGKQESSSGSVVNLCGDEVKFR